MMHHRTKGFTLIELVVSLGLFAMVMLLTAGAYLMMINTNRQAQALTFGVDNLSYALDIMARNIRTGTQYRCGASGSTDCSLPDGYTTFLFTDKDGNKIQFSRTAPSSTGWISKTIISGSGVTGVLTDSSLVNITSLTFYVAGTNTGDHYQPYVTMVANATVQTAPGKSMAFTVETSAVMRAPDIGG